MGSTTSDERERSLVVIPAASCTGTGFVGGDLYGGMGLADACDDAHGVSLDSNAEDAPILVIDGIPQFPVSTCTKLDTVVSVDAPVVSRTRAG